MFSPRSTLRSPRATPRRARGGFALLITITLLAFLVILLVGLATYTRVETAVAGNTQRQAQARQNALVGLNLAVAQLQKYAGPDTRVTATAESFPSVNSQKRRYTGVWHSDPAATADTTTPLAWLVSGIETGATVDVTQAIPAASRVALTGPKTDGSTFLANGNPGANNVVAPLQSITAPGVPGVNGTPVIGRYAWWVGDQGVKAAVAVPDASAAVNYPPWDSADLRARIRQQIALGSGAATAAGAPVFEPRDSNNTSLVANQKVVATNQLAYLRNSSNTPIGLTAVQQNFHAWSPNNLNVLASTAPATAGLRQDLSIDPTLLGAGFAKWADYSSYMEPPATAASSIFPPKPKFESDPIRRRYHMQPTTVADGVVNSVAPTLSYFLLTFNVRTKGGSATIQPLEARARWMLTLWNPYSSALVPENLRIEVTGLPDVRVDDETIPAPAATPPVFSTPPIRFSLQETYGGPLRISLPWDIVPPASTPEEDRRSWLPGRTYTWTSMEDATGASPVDPGYPSKFYSRSLDSSAGMGVVLPVPSPQTIDGDRTCHVEGDAATIVVKLFAVRAGGDVLLGKFSSMPFPSFRSASRTISASGYQFSYLFRLAESSENPRWLESARTDPELGAPLPEVFAFGPNGPGPEQYENYTTISAPDRLLDRASNSFGYTEDTPVFELPRSPILSLGFLQHLPVAGQRPFAVGNAAGNSIVLGNQPVREIFDRFFFSGLSSGLAPTGAGHSLALPNPLLRVVPRQPDGTQVTAADLVAAPNAQSSKYLLQSGAFNVNSVNLVAWSAVLRSVRFSSNNPGSQFEFIDAAFSSGTAQFDANGSIVRDALPSSADRKDYKNLPSDPAVGEAVFFRFSQSAQETYKAYPGYSASLVDPESQMPPNPTSAANTHLFQKGMRKITAGEVSLLAGKIVEAVKRRYEASGPFRTLEEFLAIGGDPADPARSLLENAISGAGINVNVPEFSSQFLTQADVMTALAPVLFPRSDTFVIRAYGEAVNPATATTAGRAWCEAIVQRVPEYFDPNPATGDAPEVAPAALSSAANRANGRRFKIISFRWLTRSDL